MVQNKSFCIDRVFVECEIMIRLRHKGVEHFAQIVIESAQRRYEAGNKESDTYLGVAKGG